MTLFFEIRADAKQGEYRGCQLDSVQFCEKDTGQAHQLKTYCPVQNALQIMGILRHESGVHPIHQSQDAKYGHCS